MTAPPAVSQQQPQAAKLDISDTLTLSFGLISAQLAIVAIVFATRTWKSAKRSATENTGAEFELLLTTTRHSNPGPATIDMMGPHLLNFKKTPRRTKMQRSRSAYPRQRERELDILPN